MGVIVPAKATSLTLFDVGPRLDETFARNAEPHFHYLNRGHREEVERIRDVLEKWFVRYPDEGKRDLRSAFRSADDWQYESAFFELALHELLVCLGCSVRLHPDIPGTKRHPDFLVTPPDGEPFYLEATIATGESAKDRAESARVRSLYDHLNALDSPNFFLSVEVYATSDVQVSAKRLRSELATWLANLDPDDVTAAYVGGSADGSLLSLPAHEFMDGGWRVHFQAIPKKSSARGQQGGRAVGMMGPGEAQRIDSRGPLRDAVVRKASRYGHLDRPSVIAVNALDQWSVDRGDVMEALLGKETFTVNVDDLSMLPQAGRVLDGAWTSKGGPRYTRNSAALVAHHLSPWTLGSAEVRLYHNPWASRPYTSCLTRLPQGVPVAGQMTWTDGSTAATVLALPTGWPISIPAQG